MAVTTQGTMPPQPILPAPAISVSGVAPSVSGVAQPVPPPVAPSLTVAPVAQGSPDPSKSANSVKAVAAPFTIQSSINRDRWFKGLIYGKHGVGKTELAGSAVDVESMRDVLMLDAESGDLTFLDNPRIKNTHLIDRIEVRNQNQIAYVQEFLQAHCRARDANNIDLLRKFQSQVTGIPQNEIATPKQYRTVIVDSLSEIETYVQYKILNIDINKVETDEIDVAGWPEFRKNFEMVKLIVRAFRDLPMNVIFCCPETWTKDDTSKFHYTPYLTGKLSLQVQGFVDLVGWLVTGQALEDKPAPRRFYIQPISGSGIPKFDAKCRRSINRNAWLDDPMMIDIMKEVGLIKG